MNEQQWSGRGRGYLTAAQSRERAGDQQGASDLFSQAAECYEGAAATATREVDKDHPLGLHGVARRTCPRHALEVGESTDHADASKEAAAIELPGLTTHGAGGLCLP